MPGGGGASVEANDKKSETELNARWDMKAKVASSGLEYGIAVTAISVPVMVLGTTFAKITGTVSGTIRAGYKILYTIFRYGLRRT